MAATLAQISERVARVLMDPGRLVWAEAVLEEAIRLALGEYNQTLSGAATLQGLDGALQSTLPGEHESLIVLGGAAHAAAICLAGKVEAFPPAAIREDLASWAKQRREVYLQGLDWIRTQDLHTGTLPWLRPGWKLDAWEEG